MNYKNDLYNNNCNLVGATPPTRLFATQIRRYPHAGLAPQRPS